MSLVASTLTATSPPACAGPDSPARAGRRACRYRTYLVADVARLGASRAFSPNGSQSLLVPDRSFPAHLAV